MNDAPPDGVPRRPEVVLVGLDEAPGTLTRTLLGAEPAERRAIARRRVAELVAEAVADGAPDRIPDGTALREVGLDSLGAVALAEGLGDALGITLDAIVVFDHPTIDALARHAVDLAEGSAGSATAPSATSGAAGGDPAPGEDLFALVEAELDGSAGQSG